MSPFEEFPTGTLTPILPARAQAMPPNSPKLSIHVQALTGARAQNRLTPDYNVPGRSQLALCPTQACCSVEHPIPASPDRPGSSHPDADRSHISHKTNGNHEHAVSPLTGRTTSRRTQTLRPRPHRRPKPHLLQNKPQTETPSCPLNARPFHPAHPAPKPPLTRAGNNSPLSESASCSHS